MSESLVVQDTADVIITDLITGTVAAYSEMQLTGIEGTISQEDLRGGIGNKRVFLLRSDKTIDLNMRSATFVKEWMAMTQGVEVKDEETANITKIEHLTVESGKVTIKGTAVDDTARVTGADGEQEEVAVATNEITIPVGVADDGDKVTVSYLEEVTGSMIEFDSTKFSRKYKVELRTIAYSVETAEVVSDIYFIFDEVMPGGDFSFNLENGTVMTPEATFSVMNPKGSDVMGKFMEVPRVTTP